MQEVIENKDNQGEEQEVVEETMEVVPEEVVEKSADELINEVYSLNQELCWWLDKEEDKKTCIIEIIENWDEWCSYLFEPTMKYTKNRLKDLWKI